MKRASHRHGNVALPGKDVRYLVAASDKGLQIALGQTLLVHVEFDCGDGTGEGDGVVPLLIAFDQIDKDIKLVALGSADLGMEYLSNPGKRNLVVILRTYGAYGCHSYTSCTSMLSYSACVPMKRMYTMPRW